MNAKNAGRAPLSPLCEGWLGKIKTSLERKKEEFGDDAEECMKFYNGPYTWLYEKKAGKRDSSLDVDAEDDIPAPTFKISINKAAEVVQLFGPAMYQRNPDRKVAQRKSYIPPIEYFGDPMNPMVQQQYLFMQSQSRQERSRDKVRAELFDAYLNYTPSELGLRDEFRLAVDEALIKGAAPLWCEYVVMPSGLKAVGTFWDSVDNLALDSDARRLENCQWIAQRCQHPVWQVEDEYGYKRGSLRGNTESAGRTADMGGSPDEDYRSESSNDLLTYWKIWSKMGIGGRLKNCMDGYPAYKEMLDQAGDYCYLAICDTCAHPLNIPPALLEAEDWDQLREAVRWPTPFWLDKGQWPMSLLTYHAVPNRLWPMAHLKPALGELKFINWVYSFLTGKIRTACRDIIVMLKSMAEETKGAIKHGPDYSVVEVDAIHADIDKCVKFLQHPGFNAEIYRVLEHMIEMFDKRTGLTEIVYGQTSTQLRSAKEADVKQAAASIRPDDMSQSVEDCASACARKEMAAARWHLEPEDVLPIIGTFGAFLWEREILTTNPAELFHQFECKVEAGSTKRPNKQAEADNINNAMNNLFSPMFSYAQATGDVTPANALIGDWATSIGLDGEKYLLKPLPPPPPPGMAPPGAGPPPMGA